MFQGSSLISLRRTQPLRQRPADQGQLAFLEYACFIMPHPHSNRVGTWSSEEEIPLMIATFIPCTVVNSPVVAGMRRSLPIRPLPSPAGALHPSVSLLSVRQWVSHHDPAYTAAQLPGGRCN